MANPLPIKPAWIVPLAGLCLVLGSMTSNAHAQTLADLQADLPTRAGPWTTEGDDRFFDAETLFGYIDGGAEVYRAYNLKQCLSRRYTTGDGPAIILDIFDMGRSEDAYGVFTHDLDGERMAIGQDGRLRPGWLSFWKDRFFVSIYMEEETPAAEKAVMDLGRQVADKIADKGSRPELLSRLPSNGLQSDRIRYLHHPVVLNFHYYLSDENILEIAHDCEVVLAEYQFENQAALLLLVEYPTPEKANHSRANFLKHYIPDADQRGAALLEDGNWTAIRGKGNLLAIVLEAHTREKAEALLNGIR